MIPIILYFSFDFSATKHTVKRERERGGVIDLDKAATAVDGISGSS
jgi:hypothetical protein